MKQVVVTGDILVSTRLLENHPSTHTAYLLKRCKILQAIGVEFKHFFGHFHLLTPAPEFKLLVKGLGAQVAPLGILIIEPLVHRIDIDVHQGIVQRDALHPGNILSQMRNLNRNDIFSYVPIITLWLSLVAT